MTEIDAAEAWGDWLAGQLESRGWRQADLVRESQGHIKRDRVSKWVNGNERPSYRLAIVVANTLNIPSFEALEAAGFGAADERAAVETNGFDPADERLEALEAEAKELAQYRTTKDGRSSDDQNFADYEIREALRDFGGPGSYESIVRLIPTRIILDEIANRLATADDVRRRRQDYGLVANDSINEFPEGNDTDYDHA